MALGWSVAAWQQEGRPAYVERQQEGNTPARREIGWFPPQHFRRYTARRYPRTLTTAHCYRFEEHMCGGCNESRESSVGLLPAKAF